jgi:hypothetical protein
MAAAADSKSLVDDACPKNHRRAHPHLNLPTNGGAGHPGHPGPAPPARHQPVMAKPARSHLPNPCHSNLPATPRCFDLARAARVGRRHSGAVFGAWLRSADRRIGHDPPADADPEKRVVLCDVEPPRCDRRARGSCTRRGPVPRRRRAAGERPTRVLGTPLWARKRQSLQGSRCGFRHLCLR